MPIQGLRKVDILNIIDTEAKKGPKKVSVHKIADSENVRTDYYYGVCICLFSPKKKFFSQPSTVTTNAHPF